jgi:predicted Fe-Mo cluster-binding NifX family protein
MKIAVASNNKINVTGHLGKCRGFMIYEIKENNIFSKQYIENTFTHHRQHGIEDEKEHEHAHEGHSHNNLIEGLNGCSVIIFNSGGWRVIEDLKSNNIYPFLTDEKDADEAVKRYLNNELVEVPGNSCHSH